MSRRTVTILTIILLIVLATGLWLFSESQESIEQAEKETIELVNYDYPIDIVNDFYWFTLDDSYFSLDFVDQEGQRRYAIVAQDGGDVDYYTEQDLISEDDAKSLAANYNEVASFMNTRLGMVEDVPVWEVAFKGKDQHLNYYYINAKSGEWLQTIGNL
ncbi:PepSY domain-containing protein [Hutsoniella sourekii]